MYEPSTSRRHVRSSTQSRAAVTSPAGRRWYSTELCGSMAASVVQLSKPWRMMACVSVEMKREWLSAAHAVLLAYASHNTAATSRLTVICVTRLTILATT